MHDASFFLECRLLFKLLPIIDDISNAIDAGKKSDDYAALLTGLEMIRDAALRQGVCLQPDVAGASGPGASGTEQFVPERR